MHDRFHKCFNETCRFRFPAPLAEGSLHACPRCGGLVGFAGEDDRPQPLALSLPPAGFVGVLDNLRSIHNVGSIFRTADGAGVGHLVLCGITATPEHPKLAKAALGAQESVGWSYCPNGLDAAAALQAGGYRLWALERLSPGSGQPSLYDTRQPDGPLALIVGNEKAGVDPGILARCDTVFSLPMSGRKSSLNAAVAFGIAAYHLRYGLAPAIEIQGGSDGNRWQA